jgi:glycosyltransferase involved in cell wall biosynthesis
MLSYDKTFFDEKPTGDVLLRHICYSEHLDKLDIVVFEPVGKQAEMKVNEKLTIYPSYGTKIPAWLRVYSKARKICRESKIDIVVTQDPLVGVPGVLLKKEFGCKLFTNVFGIEMFSERWLKRGMLRRFYKLGIYWALRNADLVRTETSRVRLYLIEKLGIPADKLVTFPVIAGPENINRFLTANGDEVRKSLLEEKYERIVLFVGRLENVKNVPSLLRAARQVIFNYPKTLFVIIGDGPEKKSLDSLCRELNIVDNVRFLGALPYDVIPYYYAACDIFVLPSWSEGFGKVLMEAAFAKKPIVATNVGGASDIIVDNETGYIVEIDNSEQMADRISRLLGNPEAAYQMGKKGYEHAIRYRDFDSNIKRLVKLWESMIVEK